MVRRETEEMIQSDDVQVDYRYILEEMSKGSVDLKSGEE